jgi:hypothetical protein
MVLFLIPVAVVGYKVWEKRRREEKEEERLKQLSEVSRETDSDAASYVAVESSLSASSESSPVSSAPESLETETPASRQHALLRSWKASSALINDQSACRDTNLLAGAQSSPPQSSPSTTIASSVVNFVDETATEPKPNALLRSWGARSSEEVNEVLVEVEQANTKYMDMLNLPTKSNDFDVDSSLLQSWSQSSEERAAIVAPLASS